MKEGILLFVCNINYKIILVMGFDGCLLSEYFFKKERAL